MSPEAARRPDWVRGAGGVEKAFLRGVAHAEMQEQGEAPREASFTLPSGSAAILRQNPGRESIVERAERPSATPSRRGGALSSRSNMSLAPVVPAAQS
eukprot:3145546-Pyramimonas_sp.AAC.1